MQIIEDVRVLKPFAIDAWVLLPDHLHCIWTLPQGDADYSKRWGLIKAGFTKAVGWALPTSCRVALPTSRRVALPAIQNQSRLKHREGFIWQRRFWEHQIRDEKDFEAHCNYIHYNPVKHGHVNVPGDWPYSTFHRFVKEGAYSEDWGSGAPVVLPDDIGGE